MPEPFSSKIGLGRNVAALPASLAVFLTTYLCNCRASAISSSGRKRRPISPWPGPPDLVVVALGSDTQRLECDHHGAAQIAEGVIRRGREITLLRAVRVAERGQPFAASLEPLPRRPMTLFGVDLVECGVGLLVEGDMVKDIELRLRPKVGDVRNPSGAQVLLRLDRHVARVARVRLACNRVEHRAHQR